MTDHTRHTHADGERRDARVDDRIHAAGAEEVVRAHRPGVQAEQDHAEHADRLGGRRQRPSPQQRGDDHRRERDAADDERPHPDVRDVPGEHEEEDRRDADERDADDEQQHRDGEPAARRRRREDGCRRRRRRAASAAAAIGRGATRRRRDRGAATGLRRADLDGSARSASSTGARPPRATGAPVGGRCTQRRGAGAAITARRTGSGSEHRRRGTMREPDRLDELLPLGFELHHAAPSSSRRARPRIRDARGRSARRWCRSGVRSSSDTASCPRARRVNSATSPCLRLNQTSALLRSSGDS